MPWGMSVFFFCFYSPLCGARTRGDDRVRHVQIPRKNTPLEIAQKGPLRPPVIATSNKERMKIPMKWNPLLGASQFSGLGHLDCMKQKSPVGGQLTTVSTQFAYGVTRGIKKKKIPSWSGDHACKFHSLCIFHNSAEHGFNRNVERARA